MTVRRLLLARHTTCRQKSARSNLTIRSQTSGLSDAYFTRWSRWTMLSTPTRWKDLCKRSWRAPTQKSPRTTQPTWKAWLQTCWSKSRLSDPLYGKCLRKTFCKSELHLYFQTQSQNMNSQTHSSAKTQLLQAQATDLTIDPTLKTFLTSESKHGRRRKLQKKQKRVEKR